MEIQTVFAENQRKPRGMFIHALFFYLLCFTTILFPQKREVNYWHVGIYDEVVMLQKLAEKFEAETGIKVKVQPLPWGNYQTKYFTAMASGDPPDAGSTNSSGGMEYGKVGGVIDLEARYPEAIRRIKPQIFPAMWPSCYYKGHLFAVPNNATALVGFYRTDIFERLGLSVPKTWPELIEVLDKLTANQYQYGFLWTKNAHWGLGNFIWSFGVYSYSDDGTKVSWAEKGFLKGYQYAMRIWHSYNIVSEKAVELMSIEDPAKALPLFFNYEANYTEILIRAPHLKDKFGVFPFPHPEGYPPASMMGGRSIVIFRDAKNPDDAMRWIEYLLSEESQLFKYRHMGNLGDRSVLDLSVNMAFWENDLNMRPGDQENLHQIYQRLNTKGGYAWTGEPSRFLEQSMYQMEELLREYHQETAARYSISIRELKQRYAAGQMADEKAAYLDFLQRTSEKLLQNVSKSAQAKLNVERQTFERYYGHLHNAATVENRKWDILDYSEWAVALLCLGFLGMVLLRRDMRSQLNSYLYIAPAMIGALVFIMIPVFVSLYLSFTKYNPVMPLSEATWVGLDNYSLILNDPTLWKSLARSAYFAIIVIPMQLIVGVILAACLDKNLWPDRLFKFIYFSPLVTSIVSVSLIWFALYAGTDYGWINYLLLETGFTKDPVVFLKDKDFFLNCVIIMTIWQGLAFMILIFLAGLQNISNSQYEAASIEGAGTIRQFFYISLPNLRPQITFLVVMGTIGATQVFEQIFMMGGGAGEAESKFGPDDSGMTIVPFIYRKGFEYFKMGEASAIAYILFIFLFILTFVNLKMIMRKE